MLLGLCCLLPAAGLATWGLTVARRGNKIPKGLFWAALAVIWIPIGLAAFAEAWWLFVEEPRRIEQGLPID